MAKFKFGIAAMSDDWLDRVEGALWGCEDINASILP